MEALDRRAILAGAGLLGAAALTRSSRAGPLDPPPGPVGPTYRTLDEVQPRVAVQTLPAGATALHVISQPGSYYLTGHIEGVPGKDGIQIEADNVDLDLCGFTLQGVGGSLSGITSAGQYRNFSLRNGTVAGWGADGVNGNSLYACAIENLAADRNGGNGIRVSATSFVRGCISTNNSTGISLGNNSSCRQCVCGSNGVGLYAQDLSAVRSCDLQFNNTGLEGGRFVVVEGCAFRGGSVGLRLSDEAAALQNSFAYMSTAIQLVGSGCFVAQNVARNASYAMGSGNTYGPIVSVSGIGSLGSTGDQAHPWANFVH